MKGTTKKWAEERYDDVQALRNVFGDNQQNIGVKLGKFSRNLVDVDLDCEEAVVLADRFLPKTSAIFGRRGNPRSHRLYYSAGAESHEFATPKTGDQKRRKCWNCARPGCKLSFPPRCTLRASATNGMKRVSPRQWNQRCSKSRAGHWPPPWF
jgi:hypothetical protein